jgi:predicted transcriptional regulator
VPKATSYDAVVILIMQFPVVMVEEGLNKIVGIITGADLVGR